VAEDQVLVELRTALTVEVYVEELPVPEACETLCTKFMPAICSCPTSGLSPTIS